MDEEKLNLNKFIITLFQAFQYADGTNRKKILDNWNEYFRNSQYI
ncbi:hypothetical protein MuYL_2366 [Mucilaginibacter xinganensis]|uniref:Uncharacterized protein n=1 Tax=Mucilaginibacter xinganensis TaxID=1234841 RepID=A0A223NWL8_9SPHI|nr:hypothetical protein MuYL_2366 [Mucilaginibacter xinganensis]